MQHGVHLRCSCRHRSRRILCWRIGHRFFHCYYFYTIVMLQCGTSLVFIKHSSVHVPLQHLHFTALLFPLHCNATVWHKSCFYKAQLWACTPQLLSSNFLTLAFVFPHLFIHYIYKKVYLNHSPYNTY
jgi:hypothetical protein